MATVLNRQAIRRAAIRQRQQAPSTLSIPAPTRGWNARDSIDQMKDDDAIVLDNWYPEFGKVTVRNGSVEHATGVGAGDVETVAAFHSGSTRKLVAAGGGEVYDATSTGAASSLGSGFTNNRWQTAMMNDKLALVNGADAPQEYDGTTLSGMTVSGSGLTATDLVGVTVFKTRSFFWENNSQRFWYSALNTLGGTLTEFPLGDVGTFGGKLLKIISWTVDGGLGVDDLAVFVMTSGEVIVYQGTDPGSASAWALVGIFYLGAPIGIRAAGKVGDDVVLVTRDGYVSLAQAMRVGRTRPRERISDRIVKAATDQIAATGASFGWQVFLYPARNQLMVNYPAQTTGVYEQHVLNLATGAWCRFKGMDARSWALHNDQPYFGGGGGVVYRGDTGTSDDGAAIEWDAQTAFNYLRTRAQRKKIVMVRPVMTGSGSLPVKVTVATDFKTHKTSTDTVDLGPPTSGQALWDVAQWDIAMWTGGTEQRAKWLSRPATGYNFSTRLQGSTTNQEIAWNSLAYVFQPAGLL